MSPRHVDPEGYIKGVKRAVQESKIDLIIPVHEEIFYLADCQEEEILRRLFAPQFEFLAMLHSKWEFSLFLSSIGLDAPGASLCRSINDINQLDRSKEFALKPVFGRASTNIYHLKPGEPVPSDISISEENHYIAQEWTTGRRYCSYSVIRDGRIQAFAVYPVQDTIDGSSAVFFTSVEHPRIREYVDRIAAALGNTRGQIALDFVETDERLVAIECNPRATSGVHLFSRTPDLAWAMTEPEVSQIAKFARPGATRQLMPGMLMWKRSDRSMKQYASHMKKLMGSKDVLFSAHDLLPSLMQPFLLTSYYKICQERKMKLPEMFQWDLTWEPAGEGLVKVRKRLEENRRNLGVREGAQVGGKANLEREDRRDSVRDEGNIN